MAPMTLPEDIFKYNGCYYQEIGQKACKLTGTALHLLREPTHFTYSSRRPGLLDDVGQQRSDLHPARASQHSVSSVRSVRESSSQPTDELRSIRGDSFDGEKVIRFGAGTSSPQTQSSAVSAQVTNNPRNLRGSAFVDEDPEPKEDKNPFQVLTRLSQNFAMIQPENFGEYATFVDDYPEILQQEPANFVEEAVKLWRRGEQQLAISCVQCSVFIHRCGDFKRPEHKRRYIRRLGGDNSDAEEFENHRSKLLKACIKKAGEQKSRRSTIGSNPSETRSTRDYRSDIDLEEEEALERLTSVLEGREEFIVQEHWTEPLESHEKDPAKRSLVNQFNARYTQQKGTFFVPGRVFSLLWHESAGEPNRGAISINLEPPYQTHKTHPSFTKGPYGEKIFSHIRRMVVIRNRQGYCWCVSINTYKGRALTNPGLTKEEKDAHAVIYDQDESVELVEGERRPKKRSIAVKMVNGQSLHPASRINFAQPFSVQWNIKVSNVGRVAEDSMVHLINYARMEIFGANLSANTTTPATDASRGGYGKRS